VGIVPDVLVEPEVEDFVMGKDRVLEKAVDVLKARMGGLLSTTHAK